MDIKSLKTNTMSTPYSKPIKVLIARITQDWTPYTRSNGRKSKFLKCYAADPTGFIEVVAYDHDTQQALVKENASLLLRNYIIKDDVLKLTTATKIYRCAAVTTNMEMVPTGICCSLVKDVQTSPSKKVMTVQGTVTQEESAKDVTAQSRKTKVKEITITDDSGEVKVSLWDDMANKDVKCGRKYKIMDAIVKYSSFHGKNTLSANSLSTIEEIQMEETTIQAEIIAISVGDVNINVIINDENDSEYICSKDVFAVFLEVDDEQVTAERLTSHLPLKCELKIKNGLTITEIK